MRFAYKKSIQIFLLPMFFMPFFTHASTNDLEVSGWIPYWRDSEGIVDAKKHLKSIDLVHPFAFTVTSRGALSDQAGLTDRDWKSFIKTAQNQGVKIVPTVMWSDGLDIHTILSSTSSRATHVSSIVTMVKKGKYDGVDIDYESKWPDTIHYFSLFLKELHRELGGKLLTCAIEARTPPESLYKVIPQPLLYANDYREIGKYCDRVSLMTYDQQRADLKLNAARTGRPYMPVSDVEWVRKVALLALKDIPKEKLALGIPTYGHHYTLTVAPDWYQNYTRIGALNVPDMLDIASDYNVKPSRNSAGEMMFTYIPQSSTLQLSRTLKIPKKTPSGEIVSARALAYANKTGETVQVNMATYSDAGAIKQKIDLAKELGLSGIALFKIDGEEDARLWQYLK